jgi:hypothetical protein
MTTKTDAYREQLKRIENWDSFILEESGLPGPRGNLELARAVAEEGDETLFLRYLAFDAKDAPTNTPHEFLAFCGTLGLGRLLSKWKSAHLGTLRRLASDPRWRIREAVAMALQCYGKENMAALLEEMRVWSEGNPLEQRAAAAALCEPNLLGDETLTREVLELLDAITGNIQNIKDRRSESCKALRKGLGYCWSVAVAALPEEGKPLMEKWFHSQDKDIIWIMKQNLRKKRLARRDPDWVNQWKTHYGI